MPRNRCVGAIALALAILGFSLPSPAVAATRGDDLVELAYVLGQSHALRQACLGEADQHWRERMVRLEEVEEPDPELAGRLRQAFNGAYRTTRRDYPGCGVATEAAERRAAQAGQRIARRLAAEAAAAPASSPLIP